MFDYATMVNTLRDNIVDVTFTKIDGTSRNMMATLNGAYLPEEYRNESGNLLSEGDGDQESVTVWDLDVGGWRRFRVSSVTSFIPRVMVV